MKRQIHQSVNTASSLLGIVAIFTSIGFSDTFSLQVQLMLALAGILMMEAGVWGLANQFMPNERRFTRLREEGEISVRLIRELNSAAVARDKGLEDDRRFKAVVGEMHASVQRMAEVASLEDDGLARSKTSLATAAE